jgi:alkaline phosphatase D
MSEPILPRRAFLSSTLAAGAAAVARRVWTPADGAPAIVTSEQLRPLLPSGAQTGDPLPDRAMLWSRTDRPARLWVEWSTREDFRDARRVRGPVARAESAYTAHLDLTGLPPGETLHYRLRFESESSPGAYSEPLVGRLRTAPSPDAAASRGVRLAWSADMVGQGWGIDESRGGLRIYDALRRAEPDLFVHSGDNIYADGPIAASVAIPDGTTWKNVVTEEVSKVAETLAEYRGRYKYNLLDHNLRDLYADVPIVSQWDDHETLNNWYPGEILTDDRYTEKRVDVLAARSRQAFLEYLPMVHTAGRNRIYRKVSYGPLLDVFCLDMRTYRGANPAPGVAGPVAMLGAEQAAWLVREAAASKATWKVIASDMPLGVLVPDGTEIEAVANGLTGAPGGREHEIAWVLSQFKRRKVRNTVWLTADVHYCAAHHYDPSRAAFTDFDPFWELVAGPVNAGTFGPNALDSTFGPRLEFVKAADFPNQPPSGGNQFFGHVAIDPRTEVFTASLRDLYGKVLWREDLPAHS